MTQNAFQDYLLQASQKVNDYLFQSDVVDYLKPDHIKRAVLSYLQRPSKRLRPAVLMMSCGAVGGDENKAIGAAAGVELFHTWTLVHDDVIDNDHLRRGEPTVHKQMETIAKTEMGLDAKLAKDYGRDIAILTGDVQHGWCITSFIDCASANKIDPRVILAIIRYLQTHVLNMLVYGEVLDVQFGLQKKNIESIQEKDVIHMLWLKTGILYEFASQAGAMIGLNTPYIDNPLVRAVKEFSSNCGIAFQLQDDILGIVGDEKRLGKPVGSDIREGKKTTVLLHALKNASSAQKARLLTLIGNNKASDDEIEEAKQLLIDLNGVDYSQRLAQKYLDTALSHLNALRASRYKDLLKSWADFMINRDL
ncbi:polyprenyl synthetase family protein [candidate division KSB1 bacterium]|nr:polyprenyl synthetase family protein [candidate division KSB1 bacterium]